MEKESILPSLAEQLYQVYGVARNWERSNGKPMEREFSHCPISCQFAWQAVADAAEKLVI